MLRSFKFILFISIFLHLVGSTHAFWYSMWRDARCTSYALSNEWKFASAVWQPRVSAVEDHQCVNVPSSSINQANNKILPYIMNVSCSKIHNLDRYQFNLSMLHMTDGSCNSSIDANVIYNVYGEVNTADFGQCGVGLLKFGSGRHSIVPKHVSSMQGWLAEVRTSSLSAQSDDLRIGLRIHCNATSNHASRIDSSIVILIVMMLFIVVTITM